MNNIFGGEGKLEYARCGSSHPDTCQVAFCVDIHSQWPFLSLAPPNLVLLKKFYPYLCPEQTWSRSLLETLCRVDTTFACS
jgi:hypothetical protein